MRTLFDLILLQRGDPARYSHPSDTFSDAAIIAIFIIGVIAFMALIGKVLEVVKYGENDNNSNKKSFNKSEILEKENQDELRKHKAAMESAWRYFHQTSEEINRKNYAILYTNKEWEIKNRKLIDQSTALLYQKFRTSDKSELKKIEGLLSENKQKLDEFRKSIGWDYWSDEISIRDLYELKRREIK